MYFKTKQKFKQNETQIPVKALSLYNNYLIDLQSFANQY